jgi:hypothetical protein
MPDEPLHVRREHRVPRAGRAWQGERHGSIDSFEFPITIRVATQDQTPTVTVWRMAGECGRKPPNVPAYPQRLGKAKPYIHMSKTLR